MPKGASHCTCTTAWFSLMLTHMHSPLVYHTLKRTPQFIVHSFHRAPIQYFFNNAISVRGEPPFPSSPAWVPSFSARKRKTKLVTCLPSRKISLWGHLYLMLLLIIRAIHLSSYELSSQQDNFLNHDNSGRLLVWFRQNVLCIHSVSQKKVPRSICDTSNVLD